mgnify:CR=1 FL=1
MSLKIIRSSRGGKMRMFEAILQDGKVYIHNGTVEVPDVKILSEGVGDSDGVVILAGSETVYIAQTTGDLKNALTIIKDGFTKLATEFGILGKEEQAKQRTERRETQEKIVAPVVGDAPKIRAPSFVFDLLGRPDMK